MMNYDFHFGISTHHFFEKRSEDCSYSLHVRNLLLSLLLLFSIMKLKQQMETIRIWMGLCTFSKQCLIEITTHHATKLYVLTLVFISHMKIHFVFMFTMR